jgi:hypothetical protein
MSGIDRDSLFNVEAFQAARDWALAHRHQQPDNRMLVEYGAIIAEMARRAGYDQGRADEAAGVAAPPPWKGPGTTGRGRVERDEERQREGLWAHVNQPDAAPRGTQPRRHSRRPPTAREAGVNIRIGHATRRGTRTHNCDAARTYTAPDGAIAAAVIAIAEPDGPAAVAWIGDCRAYQWDGAALRQYTTDHTMGQQLRASGGVAVEFAQTHDHWLLTGLRGATAATVRQVWIPDEGVDVPDRG